MRSQDGVSMYDVKKDSYDIIINAADDIPPGRVLWTKMHEIGHIYLGHLKKYEVTEIRREELGEELYNELEFEADMFAGEVLASKWLMRKLDIYEENDIVQICGISDEAARNRYKKATEEYSFIPANVTFTLHQFHEYLKEVTVCAGDEDMDENLRKYIKRNTAQKYFQRQWLHFSANRASALTAEEITAAEPSSAAIAGLSLKEEAMLYQVCTATIRSLRMPFSAKNAETRLFVSDRECFLKNAKYNDK